MTIILTRRSWLVRLLRLPRTIPQLWAAAAALPLRPRIILTSRLALMIASPDPTPSITDDNSETSPPSS